MSKKKRVPSAAKPDAAATEGAKQDAASLACLRLGWAMIAIFLALGLALESFHLVKLPLYLDVRLRRELWTLGHAHGTLLGALNVLFGLSAPRLIARADRRLAASRLLRAGAVLVPLGFFLGGIGAAEGDPSLFIVLVPAGALLALLSLVMLALDSRR